MSTKNKIYINKVTSPMDKHYTYKELNIKKEKALKDKDYISVIHYSYAMIEDRLLSFLHYLYIIDRDKYPYKLESIVKDEMTALLDKNKSEKKGNDYNPNINNISTKIKIIKKIYNYKKDDAIIIEMKKHMDDLFSLKELKHDILKLEKWIKFRNELVHSLYNKHYEDLENKIEEQANMGIYLSNQFDNYSDLLKGNINHKKSFRKILEERYTKD